MTDDERKRERREAAFRRANRKATRPGPTFNTNRPVEKDGVLLNGQGELRPCQVLASVKTGSSGMLRAFHHWARTNRIGFAPVGRDDGTGAHAEDMSGQAIVREVTRIGRDGKLVTRLQEVLIPDLNKNVRSEYILWGMPEDLMDFLERNTGDGKPIHSYTLNVPVRYSATASGSGTLTPEISRRIRDYVPDQLSRNARETMSAWAQEEPDAASLAKHNRPHTPNAEKDARAEAKRREKLPKTEREKIENDEREERFGILPGERESIERQEAADREFREALARAEHERKLNGK